MPLPLANSPERAPAIARASQPALDPLTPLSLWHLASVDAPTVAVTWSLAFASSASVQLPFWVPALIALGTWFVYMGDRLLDARSAFHSGNTLSLRERHLFHWRHRRIFIALASAAACVSVALIFERMPVGARERNSALAFAALAYFSGVHSHRKPPRWLRTLFSRALLSKELLVGVLFTAGCTLPIFTRIHSNSSAAATTWPLITAVFFANLAWLNCHAIESWESSTDARIAAWGATLGLVGLFVAAAIARIQPHPAALLCAGSASAFLLSLLDRARPRFTMLNLRALADVVLLTPVLLLPFEVHLR